MVATFSRCAVVTHWLPHTPVHLVLELKKVWCCLSPLSIKIGVFVETFCIILMSKELACSNKRYSMVVLREKRPFPLGINDMI